MISGITPSPLFSALAQQAARLDALAQGALAGGARFYQEGKYEAAAREFQRAISLSPQSENTVAAYDYLAMARLKLGNPGEAVKAYQAALRFSPNRDDFHYKLGNIFLEEGDPDQAIKSYRQALRLEPRSKTYLYSLGQAFLAEGLPDSAKEPFEKLTRLAPGDYGGFYGLGQAYYQKGEYERAADYFNQAIVLKKDFAYARLDLGYALADLGRVEEAYEQVRILKDQDPALASTLNNYLFRVARPEILAAYSPDGFYPTLGPRTPVANLDPALASPGASREFTMRFIFSKGMDLPSVENSYNWTIRRAAPGTPGGAYNWGMPVSETEVAVPVFPDRVRYDWASNTAIVTFTIEQNARADGTLDPSHLIFQFTGKDAYGNRMNPSADQYGGISRII
jgi:Flp pilus assembly protein TadD